MKQFDYLIVGAGLYGSVFAHEASKKGKKVRLQNLTVLRIRRLQIIKVRFIQCHLICTLLIKCGEL